MDHKPDTIIRIPVQPLTVADFASFGDVIACAGHAPRLINQGQTERYHALSVATAIGDGAQVGLSIFRNLVVAALPYRISMLERHPLGSQTFMPLQGQAFLIVVAPPSHSAPPDESLIRAFVSDGRQGITYHAGVWHHPLLTFEAPSDFLIVDRLGAGVNCDVHSFVGLYEVCTV